MTRHDHQPRQHGSSDRDAAEHGLPGSTGDQPGSGEQDSSVQDRGDYGGEASGEGQGEFAGDGYSAQGQFTNQRVAQYGDQGYGQDYGRQGIGWQNRDQMVPGSNGQSESLDETLRDETKAGTNSS